MKYKYLLQKLVLSAFLLTTLHAENMLYVGLTDTGWQVFQCDLATMEQKQLTKSVGDKRTPIYSSDLAAVVYKGPKGRIWSVDAAGKESLLVDIIGCGDFTLDGQDVYFTRLVTGNPQRQQLWKAVGARPYQEMELIYRPEQGSLRQIQFRAGLFLATHIWQIGEEQIVLIDPNKKLEMRALTLPGEIASYPRWVNDTKVVYSYSDDQGNYDIHSMSINTSSKTKVGVTLLASGDYSEFTCSVNAEEDKYYYERLNANGSWSIASMDHEGNAVTALPLKRQAKEPFIFTP